ncbi:hypothetical protein B0H17DRAFT_1217210 [Mycena rosella]|uniref:Uncharacterized protein n=1 Tax=Mycena rosella TaxID=1033263 RepID=A0AAD7FPL5_MYCRO|nr:hypothetical protein B0H17DRAFT_1217210 [Mycena rosella]
MLQLPPPLYRSLVFPNSAFLCGPPGLAAASDAPKPPVKQQKLTRKMRAAAEVQLRKFKDRVYSAERVNESHGFTPISAYFNNPSITAVLDYLLQISSLEKLAATIPRWKYHSRHGASLLALIDDLQCEFAAEFEAARLERNAKNRLRAKSKRVGAWMEEGDEEYMQSDGEQSGDEDAVPQPPPVSVHHPLPPRPEKRALRDTTNVLPHAKRQRQALQGVKDTAKLTDLV